MPGQTERDELVAIALAQELEGAGLTARDVHRLTMLERPDRDLDPILGPERIEALRAAGIQVTAVGVDDAVDRVTIFVSKTVPARIRSAMPESVGDVSISYSVQRFQVVNPGKVGAAQVGARRLQPGAQPIRCGTSISLGNARTAGTFGALVRLGDAPGLYGMTCNHVTGGCNIVPPGVPVVHPGVLDVDQTTDRIELLGFHDRVLPIRQGQVSVLDTDENDDVALFRIRRDDLVSSLQGADQDTPRVVGDPAAGIPVRKAGRTTGITRGRVREFMPHAIDYNYQVPVNASTVKTFQGVCNFKRVWRVQGEDGDFAKNGDSGALVTTRDGSRAIGLLYAADRSSGDGYILPLGPILRKLGAQMVGGHNV